MKFPENRKNSSVWWVLCAAIPFLLVACGDLGRPGDGTERPPKGGTYKVGNPYNVAGQWYYPQVDYAYDESGLRSWYGPQFHGKRTANGEMFNMNSVSAAHKSLPLPSVVRVTNLENGRSLIIRINDRGPFVRGRIIDLSKRAAELLGFADKGTAMVRVQVLAEASQRAAIQVGAGDLPDFGPPPPKAAPSVAVSVETLEAADGIASAPASYPVEVSGPSAIDPEAPPFDGVTDAGGSAPDGRRTRIAANRPGASPSGAAEEGVTLVPVPGQPQIFVQAGAFAQYENANRVRARLSVLGPDVSISQVYITNQPLFRVRLGPLDSVAEADQRLAQIIAVGLPDAEIVVD